jgi:hypothetical protein
MRCYYWLSSGCEMREMKVEFANNREGLTRETEKGVEEKP